MDTQEQYANAGLIVARTSERDFRRGTAVQSDRWLRKLLEYSVYNAANFLVDHTVMGESRTAAASSFKGLCRGAADGEIMFGIVDNGPPVLDDQGAAIMAGDVLRTARGVPCFGDLDSAITRMYGEKHPAYIVTVNPGNSHIAVDLPEYVSDETADELFTMLGMYAGIGHSRHENLVVGYTIEVAAPEDIATNRKAKEKLILAMGLKEQFGFAMSRRSAVGQQMTRRLPYGNVVIFRLTRDAA